MQESIIQFTKLNNRIFRNTQVYLDKRLKEYGLSSGSYSYLLILRKNEGISQNKISKELGCDKAMSARTISKLINLGYIDRREDNTDCRAYKLYLTEKARGIIPYIIEEIDKLVGLITVDLNEDEKVITIDCLIRILNNIKDLK